MKYLHISFTCLQCDALSITGLIWMSVRKGMLTIYSPMPTIYSPLLVLSIVSFTIKTIVPLVFLYQHIDESSFLVFNNTSLMMECHMFFLQIMMERQLQL